MQSLKDLRLEQLMFRYVQIHAPPSRTCWTVVLAHVAGALSLIWDLTVPHAESQALALTHNVCSRLS